MLKRKWLSIAMTFTMVFSLIPLTARAQDSEQKDPLEVAIRDLRTEYKGIEEPYFFLRKELDQIKDTLPDKWMNRSTEDQNVDEQDSEQDLQKMGQTKTVSNELYDEPVPVLTGMDKSDENDHPTDPAGDNGESGEGGLFHSFYDPTLEAYYQALDRDVFMDNRFVGTEVSQGQLDLYRLLHSYYEEYRQELEADQQQSLIQTMRLLLTVEMLQTEAIKNDVNSLMNYRVSAGQRIIPPSSQQAEVANRFWEKVMSDQEGEGWGNGVSSFVLLHNSLTKSSRVLEIYGVPYSKESFTVDTDQDGLPDVMEFQFNTNPYEKDTDHDSLTDSFEIAHQLNPLKENSDDRGPTDANEDFDNDGLTNLEEQTYGTDPSLADTDRDGLSDKDEVTLYHTNPTFSDTDMDHVSDGKEVAIGTNPLNADSDGDGKTDNLVTVAESVSVRAEDLATFEASGAVPSVTVEGVPGAGEHARLDDSYHYDVMTEKIPFLVGHPIDVKTSLPFEKAIISFQLNDNAGPVNLNDLRVMWWDEEHQQMVMLPNQQVDPVKRTVSAESTHFSRFMLIDYTKWYRVMSEGYDPGRPTVLRGPIREFAVATAYEYSGGSLFNYGVVNRNVVETSVSRAELNKDLVQNQVFSFRNTGSGYISNAIAQLASNSALADKWKVLIVASEKRKIVDPDLASALDLAVQHQIKVFTVWTGDQEGDGQWDLEGIAKKTYGTYAHDMLDRIETSVQMWKDIWAAVKKEEDVDADGIPDQVEENGILLGTGERKFTSVSMEDRNGDGIPDGRDTDGDGLTDGYELGYTDRDGHPLPQASTVSVPALQPITKTTQPLAHLIPACIGDDYECHSAKINSAPDYTDTDEDGYSDKVDEKPIEYYQRPIVFLHGVLSNTYTTYGAPTILANKYSSGEFGTGNNVNDAYAYKERMIDLKNQEVMNDYETDGLYNYLIQNAKDTLGRALYSHGKNMFVFDYANHDRWDYNGDILNDYIYRLLSYGKLKGPTVGEDYQPVVDFVVHSMGGLVTRYFNERIYPHSIQLGRLITLGTPHTGGEFAFLAQALNDTTVTMAQLIDNRLKAVDSLSSTDQGLYLMNSYLIQDSSYKHGGVYYAVGGVALPEWKNEDGSYYMPTSLLQPGTGGTHTYEYNAGRSHIYGIAASSLISDAIEQDIKSGKRDGLLRNYSFNISDGYVSLNSAFGSYFTEELPFDQRWAYIGLKWSNRHEAIHHNIRVMNRVTNLLSR